MNASPTRNRDDLVSQLEQLDGDIIGMAKKLAKQRAWLDANGHDPNFDARAHAHRALRAEHGRAEDAWIGMLGELVEAERRIAAVGATMPMATQPQLIPGRVLG